MKKLFFLLATLLPLVLVSCEPSSNSGESGESGEGGGTGGGDVPGSVSKNLIKKVKLTADYMDEDNSHLVADATLTLVYDEDDRLAQVSGNGSAVVDGDKVQGNATMNFVYKGSDLEVSVSGMGSSTETPSESFSGKYDFKLNADRAIYFGEGNVVYAQDDKEEELLNCWYDAENQLTECLYRFPYYGVGYSGVDTVQKFLEWENGNMVRCGYRSYDEPEPVEPDGNSKKTMRQTRLPFFLLKSVSGQKDVEIDWNEYFRVAYSDKPNKSNLDIAYILFLVRGGANAYADLIGALGFMGKMSRDLPAVCYDRPTFRNPETGIDQFGPEEVTCKFDYTFDENGLVTRVILLDSRDKEWIKVDFEY